MESMVEYTGEVEGEHATVDGQQKYNLDGSGKWMVMLENQILNRKLDFDTKFM